MIEISRFTRSTSSCFVHHREHEAHALLHVEGLEDLLLVADA